jgi:hypothetical protein
MKLLLTLFLLSIKIGIFAQQPCKRLPTSEQLLQVLSKKPVTSIERMDFRKGCNVTDSIENRILYLLHWEWTKQEIEDNLNNDIQKNWLFYNIETRAKILSKGDKLLYQLETDSITNFLKSERLKNLEKYHAFKVSGDIVLTAAYLNITSAIPILRKALLDSLHYSKLYVELALARFGDGTLQKKIIAENGYNKELNGDEWLKYFYKAARNLLFISTQESIFQLNNWLDASKTYVAIDGGKADTKSAYFTIIALKHAIENKSFQDIIKNIDDSPYRRMDDSIILACKKWLIKNKGKYQINRFWSPY